MMRRVEATYWLSSIENAVVYRWNKELILVSSIDTATEVYCLLQLMSCTMSH